MPHSDVHAAPDSAFTGESFSDSFLSHLFETFSAEEWSALLHNMHAPLSEEEIIQLRGLGDPLDLHEVETIYLPLSRLLNLYATHISHLRKTTDVFLGHAPVSKPFIIGIAGSVAVGKSTISRLLRELLSRWETTPKVALIPTDGFLFPNAELEKHNLMQYKGFPQSYDKKALMRFVADVKSGIRATAPHYSHIVYDIVPERKHVVEDIDVLILEGLNVLQTPQESGHVALSDLFDFSIYIDADTTNIASWYQKRFRKLCAETFSREDSYFHRYASMNPQEATQKAQEIWATINEPNLYTNILPTKPRARLILRKDAHHHVRSIMLRKL